MKTLVSEPEPGSQPATAELGATLRKAYYAVRERRSLVLLCLAAAVLFGGWYIIRTPYTFAAATTIQVNEATRNVMQIQDIQSQDLTTIELLKTIEQNLSNLTVARRVVERLHLTPEMLDLGGPLKDLTFVVHSITRPLVRLIHPRTGVQEGGDPTTDIASKLKDDVTVKLQRSTRLISVTAENRDPKLAQRIAEAFVAEYIMQRLQEQSIQSSRAVDLLAKQAEQQQTKLRESEEALQRFKEQHDAVSLENTQNITVEKLKELNAKVTEVKTARLTLEADYAEVQKIGLNHPERLLNLSSIARWPEVLSQNEKIARKEAELSNLNARYRQVHSRVVEAKNALAELKAGLDRTVIRLASGLGTTYEAALQSEKKFERMLSDQEKQALGLNKIAIPYNVLQRQADSDRALYDLVLKQMNQNEALKNAGNEEIRIVDHAVVPELPVRPRVLLTVVLSVFGGVSASLAACFLLTLLESSFKTVDEAEAELQLPLIGAIPDKTRTERRSRSPIVTTMPSSDIAEAFRTIRTELSLLRAESPRRALAFVSAIPGEGKTFCAINYAATLAQQSRRVLLIDGDLRLPSIGASFDIPLRTPGFSDCISGRASLQDVVRKTPVNHLFVLPAGKSTRNPIDLLGDGDVGQVIREAEQGFDCVVLDSAPIHNVSDTLTMLKHVGVICLVVRAATTPRKAALRAVHKLTALNARPIGFVLNGLPRFGQYYYRYGGQEYGNAEHSRVEGAVA